MGRRQTCYFPDWEKVGCIDEAIRVVMYDDKEDSLFYLANTMDMLNKYEWDLDNNSQ